MKAFQIQAPGIAGIVETDSASSAGADAVLLRINLVGMCGTDLSTFRGGNAMVTFPRIPGHEVAATVVEGATGLRQVPLLRSLLTPNAEYVQVAAVAV